MNPNYNYNESQDFRQLDPDIDVDAYRMGSEITQPSDFSPDDIEHDLALEDEAQEGEAAAIIEVEAKPPPDERAEDERDRRRRRNTQQGPLDPDDEPLDADLPLLQPGEGTYDSL